MALSNNIVTKVGKVLILTCCLVAISRVSSLFAQDEAATKKAFQNPAKKYRPMVFWWWPGGDVSDREIAREISILDTSGFGGAGLEPLVTRDLRKLPPDVAHRVNSFASPEFFAHVRTAIDSAKEHGMWIDETFGMGWPFGGGSVITPELSAIELRFSDKVVEGPRVFQGKLDIPVWQPGYLYNRMKHDGEPVESPEGWEKRFEARSKIVAVVAMRSVPAGSNAAMQSSLHAPEMLDRNSIVVLTDRMEADGTLEWKIPEGRWHIFVFRQIPTRQPLAHASGNEPQLVLDHLNKEAFAAHAHRVGDPMVRMAGADAGHTLRAVFCDSLEVQEYLFWTDDLLVQFRQRRGYDLTPYLAILRQPGYNDYFLSKLGGLPLFDVSDAGDAIRSDYWKTVSELIYERFYHAFDEWANEHKLLSRMQAHGAPGDLLKFYGDSDIPETETLGGGNTVNFMKLASSAGYDYGRKIVSSESFDYGGNPYITTPESIKANSDKLFISGINQIIYHGFPYKYDRDPKGIGWFPFQGLVSSQINEANPIWPFFGKLNQYITRLQYITQTGASDEQVAIFRSSLSQDDIGPAIATGPTKDPFPPLEDALSSSGLSFAFVNEDALLGSSAKEAQLTTKFGGKYAALVISRETNVSPALVKMLRQFVDARVPIVFVGSLPGANASFKTMELDRAQVTAGLLKLEASLSTYKAADASEAASQLAAVIGPQVNFVSGDKLPFLKKTIGATSFYLLTNPNNRPTKTTLELNEDAAPELWDPWTGTVQPLAFVRNRGHVGLVVSLPQFGSELVAFSNTHGKSPSASLADWTELKRLNVGETGWSVEAKGASEQGIDVHLHMNMTKLRDWLDEPLLRTLSGSATYVTHLSVDADDLRTTSRILLDLGEVKDAAEVTVNGVSAGQLIVHPFSVEVRHLLHAGENRIQITVVNSLSNYASTIQWSKIPTPYEATGISKPLSSGLLGPVVLKYETENSHPR